MVLAASSVHKFVVNKTERAMDSVPLEKSMNALNALIPPEWQVPLVVLVSFVQKMTDGSWIHCSRVVEKMRGRCIAS
jgi:phosphohistidine swiveling domain-containing protein